MRNSFVPGPGGILSADIAVPEHDRELEFYSSVLTTGEKSLWNKDLMNNLGMPVIGLGVRTPEYESLPLKWMPHFQVENVGASIKQALASGGQEIFPSPVVDGEYQWGALADPAGTPFGIIPAVTPEEAGLPEGESFGRIAWLSLWAPDSTACQEFYQKVIGWNSKATEAGSFEMQVDDDSSAAEIFQLDEETDFAASTWIIHLPVGDLDESLIRVTQGGGEVVSQGQSDLPTVVRDPIGVYFALQADD